MVSAEVAAAPVVEAAAASEVAAAAAAAVAAAAAAAAEVVSVPEVVQRGSPVEPVVAVATVARLLLKTLRRLSFYRTGLRHRYPLSPRSFSFVL